MKKTIWKLFTLLLLFSFMATPALVQLGTTQVAASTPTDMERPSRPTPELVPQEILDEFEGGMSIEEFLVRNQGPIPNALLDFADTPVTVIVQLEDPPLAEYIIQRGLTRDTLPEGEQSNYVAQLESTQKSLIDQITAGRNDIQVIPDRSFTFTKVLNGFMLRVPASDLNQIREIDGVKSVTLAPEYELDLSASVPLIGADQVWADPGYTGEGITIAVIDTGIDYTHAMFGGEGTPAAYDAIDPDVITPGTFPTAKVIGGYDFAGTLYHAGCSPADEAAGICTTIPDPNPNPIDQRGHGTHVAATAAGIDIGFGAGVAPNAELYALKVFGRSGSTNLTLHAIEWAMDPHGLGHLGEPVDVINMSLGTTWGPADETSAEFIAIENASALGVVVVASAGNAGNSEYIVGSPSTVNSAISVAASTTGFMTAPYIEYDDDGTKYISYTTTSGNPFNSTITADLIDVESLDVPATFCDEDVKDIEGTPLDDAIAFISRGACTFDEKINNAEKFGAVAAIVHNNEAGPFGMLTETSTLPAAALLLSDGLILKALTPIEISIGPDSNVRTFISEDPPDTIATFSSRGPRGFDSHLKPEITAPGVAIFAADMGTGNLGTGMGGTSMSAPHIAGVAALMKQANPGWTTTHIKAAMMNTAVDLADPISAEIPRQGAGRVDALEAVTTSFLAYADPQLVSLSWGVIEIGEDDFSDTQTVILHNFSDTAVTLNVSTVFTSDATGATLTPASGMVTVPAYGAAGLDVTLDLDATQLPLPYGFDFDAGLPVLLEYYGFVTFEDGGELLRVPFYFVPRPYTELTELDAMTTFDVDGMGFVELEQSGPIPSDLWAFPVSLVSPQNPNVQDAADLRYVGMDYGFFHPAVGDVFEASFAMWGDVHTNQWLFSDVTMFIDTPTGSVMNFNYDYGWLTGGPYNDWVVLQVDFADGQLYFATPFTIYTDFNSGFQEWYLPAAWNYVDDVFEYEVYSFDWYGNMDYGGAASFDITRPPLLWGLTAGLNPYNQIFNLLFMVDDLEGYEYADIAGIMLVDYFGKPGAGQSYFWELEVLFTYYLPLIFN